MKQREERGMAGPFLKRESMARTCLRNHDLPQSPATGQRSPLCLGTGSEWTCAQLWAISLLPGPWHPSACQSTRWATSPRGGGGRMWWLLRSLVSSGRGPVGAEWGQLSSKNWRLSWDPSNEPGARRWTLTTTADGAEISVQSVWLETGSQQFAGGLETMIQLQEEEAKSELGG